MCEPFAVAAGGTLASGILGGVAAYQQGQAQKRAAQTNAGLALEAAGDALQRSQGAALRTVLHGAAVQGQQVAQLGASGVNTARGSAFDIQQEAQAFTAFDTSLILTGGAREAYAQRLRALAFEQEGANAEAAGKGAMIGSFLGTVGKLGGIVGERVLQTSDEKMAGAGKTEAAASIEDQLKERNARKYTKKLSGMFAPYGDF